MRTSRVIEKAELPVSHWHLAALGIGAIVAVALFMFRDTSVPEFVEEAPAATPEVQEPRNLDIVAEPSTPLPELQTKDETAETSPPPVADAVTTPITDQTPITQEGYLRWSDRRPIANAEVDVRRQDGSIETLKTDERGRFEIEGKMGEPVFVEGQISVEGTTISVRQGFRIGGEVALVSVDEPAFVEGIVVDAETGQAIPNPELGWVSSIKRYGQNRTYLNYATQGDEFGYFTIAIQSNTAYVFARAKGYADAYVQVEGLQLGETTSGVEIKLLPGRVLEGWVVDAEHQPVPDARVFLGDSNNTSLRMSSESRVDATTDESGYFYIASVPDNVVRVSAHAEGLATGSAAVPEFGGQVTIKLISGASVGGVITQSGRPVVGMSVGVETSGFYVETAMTDEQGYYQLDQLVAGEALFKLRNYMREITLIDGEYQEIDIDLDQFSGRIHGQIRQNGRPLPLTWSRSMVLTVFLGDGHYYWVHGGSDGQGNYEFRDVPGGKFRIGLRQQKYIGIKYEYGDLSPGEELEFDIEFTEGATVYGTVSGIQPGYRNVVHIFDGNGEILREVSSLHGWRYNELRHMENHDLGDQETYRFQHLGPGRYHFVAVASPEESSEGAQRALRDQVTVELEDGEELELNFNLMPKQ